MSKLGIDAARSEAEAARTRAEVEKVHADTAKAKAEVEKVQADAAKARIESVKTLVETRWYPYAAFGTFATVWFSAVAAIIAGLIKLYSM
jgi:maltodextrin utilization protein YvdJ